MNTDRGDEISDQQCEFLLYQNAMANLAFLIKTESDGAWWELIRQGWQEVMKRPRIAQSYIQWFHRRAEAGDAFAVKLITKVTELRLKS